MYHRRPKKNPTEVMSHLDNPQHHEEDEKHDAWVVIQVVLLILLFAGLIAVAVTFGVLTYNQNARLTTHTHPQCYGALTKNTTSVVNISKVYNFLEGWKEVVLECMQLSNDKLVIQKDGFYEFHGAIVVLYNVSYPSLVYDIRITGPANFSQITEVYRLYFVVNGNVVGTFSEGGFWRPGNAPPEADDIGYSHRSSTSHHQLLDLKVNDAITLALGPANMAFHMSNFSRWELLAQDLQLNIEPDSYLVWSADLSASLKEATIPSFP
jgi:hypothetical protein